MGYTVHWQIRAVNSQDKTCFKIPWREIRQLIHFCRTTTHIPMAVHKCDDLGVQITDRSIPKKIGGWQKNRKMIKTIGEPFLFSKIPSTKQQWLLEQQTAISLEGKNNNFEYPVVLQQWFCKTQHRPYTLIIKAILLLIKAANDNESRFRISLIDDEQDCEFTDAQQLLDKCFR